MSVEKNQNILEVVELPAMISLNFMCVCFQQYINKCLTSLSETAGEKNP